MIQVDDFHSVRKKLGLSQEKLAEALGVSRNTVSRWERGESSPTADNLIALERLLADIEQPAAPGGGPAAQPQETQEPLTQQPPPTQEPIHRSRSFWAICALAVGGFIAAVVACVGIYLTNAKLDRLLPEDNLTPIEEIKGEEVDISGIEPAILQPLQP